MRILLALAAPLMLGGCIVGTAVDIVTLPVKAVSRTVDLMTTSQSEADERRGREIRERDECTGEEQRRAERKRRGTDYSRC